MTQIDTSDAIPASQPAGTAKGVARHWSESRALSPILLIALILLWEGLIRWFEVPKIVVPAPSAVFVALWDGIVSGLFWPHFLVTLWEIVAGFGIGSVIGILLGILIGLSPLMERLIYPYVVAFQTLPKVAIAPIIVIWFGYGLSSKIIITATIAFFPLLANTIVGLRSAPREQIEMLEACTANRWQIFRMIRLPQALPFIFVGLDVAVVLSVIGAIVGEFVGARAGLGYLILQKNFSFDMAGVFAILIILSMIGVGLHMLVVAVQRRVLFWSEATANSVTGA
ncbi:ABC transporter permease [Pseudooceanicola sediminis]|mgnify:CR=1 FL=1|uniref:ABC transporter permease n=1 Tax=Pseudooceanicola sediminis TaxID=2211117 RepID=A0A399J7K8_9RHOB|nr:ABC transporter permease [Pseudooceanicola sediminis]KAA2313912.1 ABC transporter permease [Puniceibacterium sp. HSS470]RII38726.1 ABC transporter permease [Pseudooceanicola sediminis]|tara:strand:+ start:36432 stop:37280 length:849 start_codon:yes stop_codon:yes gene_type:complete